jgi:glycosyltransferase involved in cell wall biosynthesis
LSQLISVVIPLYNKATYIEATIKSVLINTEYVSEIIVVDDGSTDGSYNVVKAMDHPLVRLISQKNGGVSKARNTGIREARGVLIAFLDADDLYRPAYLISIINMYKKYPEATAYATSYSYLCKDGFVEPIFSRALPAVGFCGPVSDFHAWGRKASFFFTSSVCVRRDAIIHHRLFFPEGEQLGEDIDVWLRISELGEIIFFRQALVEYRLDSINSLSFNNRNNEVLPCYKRLVNRLEQGRIPKQMQKGAKQTYANQLMLIAQSYAKQRAVFKACAWMFKKYAFNARYYWLKTAWIIFRNAISSI